MACIYHQVPENTTGEALYPLSALETFAPEIYRRQLAKYNDHSSRQRIPYQEVPKLNCLRREVLTFSPFHPHLIYRAWQALDVTLSNMSWYRLPVETIAHLPAVTYQPDTRHAGTILEEATTWLEPATFQEVSALSKATRAWYAELHRRGCKGGWFAREPHVLVRGAVPIKEVEVIDWRTPNSTSRTV